MAEASNEGSREQTRTQTSVAGTNTASRTMRKDELYSVRRTTLGLQLAVTGASFPKRHVPRP